MAANVEEVIVSARAFPNVLAMPISAQIGDLRVQTSLEEIHTDTLQATEHPVESGAAVSDHSYKRPSEVVLRCGWSNSNLDALRSIVSGIFSGGTMTKGDFISGIYSQLLQLQQARELIEITTSLRHYQSMLITGLQVSRDQKTSQILSVSATCRELIIVSTISASLPPKEQQAEPSVTAEVEDIGPQQVVAGTPAPGGSVPPNEW